MKALKAALASAVARVSVSVKKRMAASVVIMVVAAPKTVTPPKARWPLVGNRPRAKTLLCLLAV